MASGYIILVVISVRRYAIGWEMAFVFDHIKVLLRDYLKVFS